MSRTRPFARTIAVAAAGATIALLVTGLGPASRAEARRAPQIAPYEYDLRHHRHELARLERELERYQRAYSALEEGINRVERINNYYRSPRARPQIQRAVDRARAEAAQQLEAAPQPYPHPQRPAAVDAATFNRLLAQVRGAGLDEHRRNLIMDVAANYRFTVAQVIAFMRECSFESTRIDVAVLLYPAVVDPESWSQVYDQLSFLHSRQELRERLQR
jgi:hypothetical protein